jgi:hypothetical protein
MRMRAEERRCGPESVAARFARIRPKLYHVTSSENVEGIARRGLRTAAQLAAEGGVELAGVRQAVVRTSSATIRDQKPIVTKTLLGHLDGITLDEWLAILNGRIFLFPEEDRAGRLARTYADRSLPQAVLAFDTSQVLAAAGDRLEVADRNTGSVPRAKGCPCRGRSTFVALSGAPNLRRIQEVTVVGGLEAVDFARQ